MKRKIELAVIIPYYKKIYFDQVLNSFATQTDQRFRIYIGDDCSPDNIDDLIDQYRNKLNIKYVRFDHNLGKTSLVQQWTRSIKLCTEEWIWLFSDDDIAGPNCVRSFYMALDLNKNKYPIYRFNTILIDKNSHIREISPPLPQYESAIEFLYHRLNGHRHSCGINHIFSKQVFKKAGGFVDLPLAWYSDDASWISFAGKQGFYTLDGDQVKWRLSDSQISSKRNKDLGHMKAEALIQYLKWIENNFKTTSISDIGLDLELILKISKKWLLNNLVYLGGHLSIRQTIDLSERLSKIYNNSTTANIFLFIKARLKSILRISN